MNLTHLGGKNPLISWMLLHFPVSLYYKTSKKLSILAIFTIHHFPSSSHFNWAFVPHHVSEIALYEFPNKPKANGQFSVFLEAFFFETCSSLSWNIFLSGTHDNLITWIQWPLTLIFWLPLISRLLDGVIVPGSVLAHFLFIYIFFQPIPAFFLTSLNTSF